MHEKATQRPWTLAGDSAWSDAAKDRGNIFSCSLRTGTHVPEDQNEINAELIVTAVNAFDDLVAALRPFANIAGDPGALDDICKGLRAVEQKSLLLAVDAARDALAKAKERRDESHRHKAE